MKSSVLRTLVTLSLSTVFNHVALLAQDQLCATIPFDFTVGPKSLTAGKYCVQELQPYVLQIRNTQGGSSTFTMTLPADPTKEPGVAKFTFRRYGNNYFLAEVSDNKNGRRFYQSVAEKELIAKASSPEPAVPATILASK
jgi:hypothetical protein